MNAVYFSDVISRVRNTAPYLFITFDKFMKKERLKQCDRFKDQNTR